MESSEDDAGAATNASRRASAREKDIGHIEDVDATASSQQGSSQCGTSTENLAMSEDNFDGDSVPSPSTQDVNTSTEAILDMIDEIVDGPGAPKRLPHRPVAAEGASPSPKTDNPCTDPQQESVNIGPDENTSRQQESRTATSAKSEIVSHESVFNIPAECTPHDDTSMATVDIRIVETSQASSSALEVHEVAESTQSTDVEQPTESNLEAETLSRGPFPNVPSSTVTETLQNVDNSECQTVERTVKCVTSSDNRDEVTVESAESTSSDNSVNKSTPVEVVTRSPLRRRLVRPAPSDRRPDTTVSSTVDSQTSNIHTTGQTSSESITKDVSSSSDAVPLVYANVKEEEIRNVSEISVCKAETSMSPSKKIKLIRQKVTPSTNVTDNIILPLKNDHFQASSSNNQLESCTEFLNNITTSELINEEKSESSKDCVSNESPVQIAQPVNECVEDKLQECEKIEQPEQDECLPKTESVEVSKENDDLNKVAPIKLNLSIPNLSDPSSSQNSISCAEQQSITGIVSGNSQNESESKQVPKLTIKLGSKQSEDMKSPIPKLTIKPIRPSADEKECRKMEEDNNVPCVTKLNIKPILKPSEKINDVHRKSSSSEISESESSENDESTSTSDQASISDQGTLDVVPKVTIKLGKPGTESEGKFYTEQNVPKLTIKGIQQSENEQESGSKLKLVISQSEDTKQLEKVPKLTIKTVTKSEGQPLSPKLTIKPLKPPDNKESITEQSESSQIPKLKISTESYSSIGDVKENTHVPKITIKPVTKTDADYFSKTPKKSTVVCDSSQHIPVVTKLNIKPILKPVDNSESSGGLEERVPVISKINIKPIINPKDNEVHSSKEDLPKITKLNIKPLKSPEGETSVGKDCDELNADDDKKCIPVVTKLNIKPIVKPMEEEVFKDTENQSSETGNSSDDNTDLIPVITKLNIKPILKPKASDEFKQPNISNEENIPVVTRLNIKPIIKPEDHTSFKKDHLKNVDVKNSDIPVITKLNIKPVLKPNEIEPTSKEHFEEMSTKNPPLVMKINMKAVSDISNMDTPNSTDDKINSIDNSSEHTFNNTDESIPIVSKLNIKPISKPSNIDSFDKIVFENVEQNIVANCEPGNSTVIINKISDNSNTCTFLENLSKLNCVPDLTEGVSSTESITQHKQQPSSNVKTIKSTTINDEIIAEQKVSGEEPTSKLEIKPITLEDKANKTEITQNCNLNEPKLNVEGLQSELKSRDALLESIVKQIPNKQQLTVQNCTLLKKLLENKKEDSKCEEIKTTTSSSSQSPIKTEMNPLNNKDVLNCEQSNSEHNTIDKINSDTHYMSPTRESVNDRHSTPITLKIRPMQDICKETSENITKPLEINVSDKVASNQSSGQDSPRIILKINKTDHGPSAKIITEEVKRPDFLQQNYTSENNQEIVNDRESPKKNLVNSRRKTPVATPTLPVGKRLRSSRIVQEIDKTPIAKRSSAKRPPSTETTTTSPQKESELSVLETKRLKLGQLLSTKSLTITPAASKMQQIHTSPVSKPCLEIKHSVKAVNHSVLNNENCSKNGNSKLHNILSNLHAKQMKSKENPFSDINCLQKPQPVTSEMESNTSTGSSDVVEIIPVENSHPEVQEMIINESFESRDFNMVSDEISQDPLEVDKNCTVVMKDNIDIPKPVEMTPQPKKRGRPRKLPVSEGAKPVPLPIPALEERPQRSLRLSRDRPTILVKPRGRGRGRGTKRVVASPSREPAPTVEAANKFFAEEEKPTGEIDPTSSRIKLPRMTEALDKMPSVCSTPLSSRGRSSSAELTQELKVVLENTIPNLEESCIKSPETPSYPERRGRGGRGGRGSRGGRGRPPGRSPRARGRGRGGGRGAMYMKETMGIYGRVCGPATTTVQLFEEETCMMDDNATPAKPSHLLDEDSQSSVKSSTNESSKMKKSKFADLFDSNKVWTAADVKEYVWPPPEKPDVERQVMMVQEQVAMFLGVKSFKRRYPELKRRTIVGEERDYVLSKNLVTEALCDLGITAVDASEVLDIMLSDYPHKYEEYRSHQRERQLIEASSEETTQETKIEVKADKEEVKPEPTKPVEIKPEPPKVDPEKTRQDMAAAAIASASEWNTRLNASRRPACVDLQTLTVQRRRAPPPPPRAHVAPPAGLYPHALLPGQYQHWYRLYSYDQLRYFPLNTALAAPPAPPSPADSGSDSEPDWGSRSSSSDESVADRLPAKRKKLTKVKRSSQPAVESGEGSKGAGGASGATGAGAVAGEAGGEGDVCRTCGLREEGNRKYAYERFLVCANCNAKLHPSCSELGADTVRKCREYAWQCAECKSCCACRRPADDDKMLFCDLCDRGFHIYCVGLDAVPTGRWHCVECAICKSCGTRDPSGSTASTSTTPGSSGAPSSGSTSTPGGAEWHHQTRRGPGGHKLYSHSLCTPCARAYRIGRYCPLCERSFIGPKGTMQLVICKLCDRQLHQECVRQTVSSLNVLDYTCGECRRGGITSRAAAARLAPRTIATLFMAKRRFNKYAHRQYMQSRQRLRDARPAPDAPDTRDASDAPDESGDASDPLDGADPLRIDAVD